jgi:hypothetical protein
VGRGSRDSEARRVQELLCLHGYEVSVDGDFGPATEQALRRCQKDRGLEPSGQFDEEIFDHLSLPFHRAMAPIPGPYRSYGDLIARYALQHLAEHPREVGVPNGGPWVRIYMKGTQGSPWCCGFVCFILRQAADTGQFTMPFDTTFGCDELAKQAKKRGLFVGEGAFMRGNRRRSDIPPGSIFLRRKTDTDWTHTGLVLSCGDESFETIEGNTNDEGSREGFEVCRRHRGYANIDFILVGHESTPMKKG